jgi:hypothetical protein
MHKTLYNALDDDFAWTDEQFNTILNDHLELLDILGYLTNTLFEKKIQDDSYKYYSETLAFKYLFQSLNLNTILKGTRFVSKIFGFEQTKFDISSSYILQRSLIENYLTFYYLYVQPKNAKESRCRWLIYQISGLNGRQDFTSDYIDYKPKIEKERGIIEELTSELKDNEYFRLLPSGKQRDITKRKPPKIFSWKELFMQCDIKDNLLERPWRLYSNYAHSEYISLIQLKEYVEDQPGTFTTKHSLSLYANLLTSIFIADLRNLYKEIEDNYYLLPEDQREYIEFLNKVGRKSTENI